MCRLKGDEVIPGTGPVGMRKDINEYYRALGINPGADPTQIRRAYRQLVQQWHPDLFKQGSPMQTTAEDITKEINEAYEQLYRKGLYKKFRAAPGKSPEQPAPPEKSPGEEPSPRQDNVKKPRPQARPKRRRERPAPAAAAPERPKGKRSWSILGNIRIFSPRFWTKAAIGAALVVGSLALGNIVWKSVAGLAPPVAVGRHAAPAVVPGPSQDSSRPNERATEPARAPVPSPLTPIPLTQIDDGSSTAARRGAISAELIPSDWARMKAFHPADSATLFARAESLLDVFEIGDTKARVVAIQGVPDDAAENMYRYGSSLVYFRDGRVWNWSDGLPRLRVRAWLEFNGSLLDTFSIGSTRGDVVRAQGTPSVFTLDGYYYGSSAVFFDNDRVRGWSEGDVALKRMSMPVLPFFDLDSLTFR